MIHYSVANMPGAAAATSTCALTTDVRRLADRGVAAALSEDRDMAAGLSVRTGQIVAPAVAGACLAGEPLDRDRMSGRSGTCRYFLHRPVRLRDPAPLGAVEPGGAGRPPRRPRASTPRRIRFLQPVEVEALLRAIPDDELGPTDAVLLLCAVTTGLRQGELLALRWLDVDWLARRIRVADSCPRGRGGEPDTPKSHYLRSVPMADRLVGELERHFQRSPHRSDDDLVFRHPHTGLLYDVAEQWQPRKRRRSDPDGSTGDRRPRPGGSPFNVAVGLARLGNRTALMARFADDRYGRLLRSVAAAEGIDVRGAPRAAEPTRVAIASVDDGPRATYGFEIHRRADWQWTAAELRDLSQKTEVLHFGSIASWTPPGAERIADLVDELRKGSDVLISYDPNIRPVAIGQRRRGARLVERSVGRAHVVKASREDVEYPRRHHIGFLALFVALGGTSYAAVGPRETASAPRR